jgi:hypothetical protein
VTDLEEAILRALEGAGVEGPPVEVEHVLRFLGLDDINWDYQAPAHDVALYFDPQKGKQRIRMPARRATCRQSFDLAHECVEFIALREGLKTPHWKVNRAAAELLLPSAWVTRCLEEKGFDLFAMHCRFSTASLEVCAQKMRTLAPGPTILTVADSRGQWRRFFSPYLAERPISDFEKAVLEEAFTLFQPFRRSLKGVQCQVYPVPSEKTRTVSKVYLFACLGWGNGA